MLGYDVVMTTGTDEHGVNVERSARKAGVPESEFVAKMAAVWRETWDELGIQGDEFIRTTDVKHARTVQWLFRLCRENGYVYKGNYVGQYCIYDNAYVADAGPGDNCPDCGRPTETVTEENYFFKLSAFQNPLLDLYAKHPEFIQPEARRNEVLSFVEGGLRDLSITRTSIRWGIPLPGEESHVFYVWFDALTAYLSAVGGEHYERRGFWPADVHVVGKEIIRFHAVYWPAFLMAAGLPLPKQIWAHGWLLMESSKMSKSRGNVVKPRPIANVLGMDALRYFLLREVVFGQDGNFSYDALVQRYNSDLANGLGNLASRVLTMIEQHLAGNAPAKPSAAEDPRDVRINDLRKETILQTCQHYERFEFSRALETIWRLIAEVDKYLVETKPWVLVKAPASYDQFVTTMYTAYQALREIVILAHPVLPAPTQRIWKQMGQTADLGSLDIHIDWPPIASARVGRIEAVFPRIEKSETIERMEAMEKEASEPAKAPASAAAGTTAGATPAAQPTNNKIAIEDFMKVEMRVGQVHTAERVQGADKLLKVNVDIGGEVRQIVAGIAQHYKPEDLVGRKVIVVVNLQPRKLRGVESNGMIVAASAGPEGKPVLAGFLEDVPVGARLK